MSSPGSYGLNDPELVVNIYYPGPWKYRAEEEPRLPVGRLENREPGIRIQAAFCGVMGCVCVRGSGCEELA